MFFKNGGIMKVENITNQKYFEQSSKVESPTQVKNASVEFKETLQKSNIDNVSKGNNVQNQQMNLATNLAPMLNQGKIAQNQISNGYLDIKI